MAITMLIIMFPYFPRSNQCYSWLVALLIDNVGPPVYPITSWQRTFKLPEEAEAE